MQNARKARVRDLKATMYRIFTNIEYQLSCSATESCKGCRKNFTEVKLVVDADVTIAWFSPQAPVYVHQRMYSRSQHVNRFSLWAFENCRTCDAM